MFDPITVIFHVAYKLHLWRKKCLDFDNDVEPRELVPIEYTIYPICGVIAFTTTPLYEQFSEPLGLPSQELTIVGLSVLLVGLLFEWAVQFELPGLSRLSTAQRRGGLAILLTILFFLQVSGNNALILAISLVVFSGFSIYGVSRPRVPVYGRYFSVIALWLFAATYSILILQFEAWLINYLDPLTSFSIPSLSVIQAYLFLNFISITSRSSHQYARGAWIIAWALFLFVGVLGFLIAAVMFP